MLSYAVEDKAERRHVRLLDLYYFEKVLKEALAKDAFYSLTKPSDTPDSVWFSLEGTHYCPYFHLFARWEAFPAY